MTKVVHAKFMTKYGDIYWGPIEVMDEALPTRAVLEQYAGTFQYDHDTEDGPVYREQIS